MGAHMEEQEEQGGESRACVPAPAPAAATMMAATMGLCYLSAPALLGSSLGSNQNHALLPQTLLLMLQSALQVWVWRGWVRSSGPLPPEPAPLTTTRQVS